MRTNDTDAELDRLQNAYKSAADIWVAAIRSEAQLASVNHTVAQIDSWENGHFLAEDGRPRRGRREGKLRGSATVAILRHRLTRGNRDLAESRYRDLVKELNS
jgi:hypothetical protein